MAVHESLWLASGGRTDFPTLDKDIEVDVAIVGAGITGITAAYMLRREGERVAVLERERVGSGVSARSTALLTSFIDAGYVAIERNFGRDGAQLVARSMQRAVEQVEAISREVGMPAFERVPGYYFAHAPAAVPQLRAEYEAAQRAGLPVEWESDTLIPPARHGAFAVHGQAQFHPVDYCQGLARFIQGVDVRIYERTRVLHIEDGDRVRVHTARGVVTAKRVILATHTPAGVSLLHTEVAPYRSYVLALRLAAPLPAALFWDTDAPYHYVRRVRTSAGVLALVGGADHKTGKGQEEEAYARLDAYARASFGVEALVHRWSGQIYEPADRLPFIGRAPLTSNVYVGTGYAGDGTTFGTLAGLMLADQCVNRAGPYDDLYSPSRVKPVAMGKKFLKENADVARHFVADRLSQEEVHSLRDVVAGEGRLVQIGMRKVAAYRDPEGKLYALRATCTHMKCIVQWNAAEKSWDCPCHGSRFQIDGAPIEGPALHALERYDMRLPQEEPAADRTPDITPQATT